MESDYHIQLLEYQLVMREVELEVKFHRDHLLAAAVEAVVRQEPQDLEDNPLLVLEAAADSIPLVVPVVPVS